MQPMISQIDHESRYNSHRANDDREEASEQTPLLQRFPETSIEHGQSHTTTVIVSFLLIILISGIVIGIYLLIIQNESENILPPLGSIPLQLVSRLQWDPDGVQPNLTSSFKASQVIVVQTDTQQCNSLITCSQLLRALQDNYTSGLPYNFLVSSNGQTYKALGWHLPSPMFRQFFVAPLVIAFIGNFTEMQPTQAQLNEAKNFFAESVNLQHLDASFQIIGKNTKFNPKYLFLSFSNLPQWNNALSDP